MKMLVDHDVSPRLGRALAAYFRDQHEIVLLREMFAVNTPDIEWMTALGQDPQWVILSADRRITRNASELRAFREAKLIGFFMSKGLNKAPVIKQTERMFAIWETIESLVGTVRGGAMFEIPMKSKKLDQL